MNITNLLKNEKSTFIIAVLMIAFGMAEVVTGFRHEFFGLVTDVELITTIVGAGLGLCYLFGGIFLLIFKKWTLTAAFTLLIIDVIGRLTMVFTNMYPVNSVRQFIGIAGGTLVAACFAVFVFIKRRKIITNKI